MSYVVLARKWRPQSFEDLIGQSHVSTTIANAIAQNRVAHAFLFTGVRGVGKTTSARILAKALNCVNGPTATPCQVCPQCKEITVGADVDVQEIDGASYNGVDEVRRLQETLPYRPQRDRFKIFIVDEVHMLSNAAWNAFLKTLEEPPPHVKFIFATTEVHKVPVTILSRCQRYDFKLIQASAIASRLRYVLDAEGIGADDAALNVLAREAAGSMRDAMSLLDQVIAWLGGGAGSEDASGERPKLTALGVAKVLGVADRVVLHRLAEALVTGDAAGAVQTVGELANQGYDLAHTARDFLSHLRDLVVAKVAKEPRELLELASEELADVMALAARADLDDLTRVHQGFSKAFDEIVKSGQPRAALEMTLVRLARRPPLLPIDELLRRLADLERRLGGGGGGNGGGPAGGGGGAPRGGPGGPAGPAGPGGSGGPPRRASMDGATPASSFEASRETGRETPRAFPREQPREPVREPPRESPREVMRSAPPITKSSASAASFTFVQPTFSKPPPPPSAKPVSFAPTTQAELAPPMTPMSQAELATWRAVLALVRSRRPALASVLEHAVVLRLDGEQAEIAYEQGSFLIGQAQEPAARDVLTNALASHFQATPALVFTTIASKQGRMTLAMAETSARKEKLDVARKAVADHPLVTAAIQILGAELREVRLAEADA